jgi:hypothetical protein
VTLRAPLFPAHQSPARLDGDRNPRQRHPPKGTPHPTHHTNTTTQNQPAKPDPATTAHPQQPAPTPTHRAPWSRTIAAPLRPITNAS